MVIDSHRRRGWVHVLFSRLLGVGINDVWRFGWDDTPDVIPMNNQLSEYNAAAMTIAHQDGIPVADLWQPVLAASRQFSSGLSPWSDGVHLSDLGDTIVAHVVEKAVKPMLGTTAEQPDPDPWLNLWCSG